MQHLLSIPALLITTLVASAAWAQQKPAPAPDTMFTLESSLFDSGSSGNFSQAFKAFIDNYYEVGACEEAVTCDDDETAWSCCDHLRIGLSVHAGPDCDTLGDGDPLAWYYAPQEDGGKLVKDELQTLHNKKGSEYCDDDIINHDTAYQRVWENTFPGGVSSTDPQLDEYWERPHINFSVIKNLPRSADGSNGNRVVRSLAQACQMFTGGYERNGRNCSPNPGGAADGSACTANGECASSFCDGGTCAEPCTAGQTCECPPLEPNCTTGKECANRSGLPSMPTWVMTERRTNSSEAIFAGMVAAAGGTGYCEFCETGDCTVEANWEGIDVCDHIAELSVTETSLRTGFDDGRYRCGAATGCNAEDPDADCTAKPGAMDFPNDNGTLNEMKCQLFGSCSNNQNQSCTCSAATDTDIIGVFQCIRQLPRGVTVKEDPDDPDHAVVRYCPDGVDDDGDIFDDFCVVLRESQGEIEFMNDEKTLFVIVNGGGKSGASCDEGDPSACGNDPDSCQGGTCPGEACTSSNDCVGACVDGFCHGTNKCDGGKIEVFQCPTDDPCDTGLAGRCGPGHIACPDGQVLCKSNYEGYPEICNGLDDDCDGKVDNMSTSWDKDEFSQYSLPDEYLGLDCNLIDVCQCPGGATDVHFGGEACDDGDTQCQQDGFLEFLEAWDPICACGEGLGYDDEPLDVDSDATPQSESACSAIAGDAVPLSFLALVGLGFFGVIRRRRF